MAALPYMQLYVADYLADTMHLTTEEHGAYLLIIMNYWQTGKPVPIKRLASVARLSNDRWISVSDSLSDMFNDTGTHWEHKRIEADLLMVKESQDQRSKAGKASAEARKNGKREAEKLTAKGMATVVEIPLNENPTNRDTDKIREDTELKDLSPPAKVTPKDYASFDDFWLHYPRKTSKSTAQKIWAKLKPTEDQLFLITKNINSRLAAGDWDLGRKDFIPHPSTYLNGKRWEDEVISKEKGNEANKTFGGKPLDAGAALVSRLFDEAAAGQAYQGGDEVCWGAED